MDWTAIELCLNSRIWTVDLDFISFFFSYNPTVIIFKCFAYKFLNFNDYNKAAQSIRTIFLYIFSFYDYTKLKMCTNSATFLSFQIGLTTKYEVNLTVQLKTADPQQIFFWQIPHDIKQKSVEFFFDKSLKPKIKWEQEETRILILFANARKLKIGPLMSFTRF